MSKFKDSKLKQKNQTSVHQKRRSARTKLIFALTFFATIFSVSSVYAASTGWINVYGVVARTQQMDIVFSNAEFVGLIRTGESVVISAADNYKTFHITARLMMPGDSRAIQFRVKNIGNQAVRLLNISTSGDTLGTGLFIEWPDDIPGSPNLTNYMSIPGTESDTFLIYIYWDAGATNVTSGLFRNFSLTLNYQNAMLPL